MLQAVAAMLAPAMGVAISPFPILGLILLMLGKKGRADSVSFMVGWMLGNGVVYSIAMLAMDSIVAVSAAASDTLRMVVHLLVAALLIFLAVREVRKMPKAGQEAAAPKWLNKMEGMGPGGAFGIAILLSAFNPVDMALSLSAGVRVGGLTLSAAQYGWSVLVFALLASCTVIVPAVVYLAAGRRMDGTLRKLSDWLVRYGDLVLAVLFFALAAESLFKAFG